MIGDQIVEFPFQLIGLGGGAPAQVGLIGIAGKKPGEVGTTLRFAGSGGKLVGQRFVVGLTMPAGPVCGNLEVLQRLGGRTAAPGQIGLQDHPLRRHVLPHPGFPSA